MWQPAQVATLPPVLILTNSDRYGVGSDIRLTGAGVPTSAAWTAVNRALYLPLYIDRPGIVTKLLAYNGATAAGNVDIGLYDRNYNRIVSKGSTAQAGTSVLQEFDVTDFSIVPGVYFVGLAASLTTTTFFMCVTNISGYLGGMGITQEASALPLPATATPVQVGSAVVQVPVAGIAFRALVA